MTPKQLAEIGHDDDAVDDLCRHLFTLMDQLWKHGVHAAANVTLLGRFYERFADHAVEICCSATSPESHAPPAMTPILSWFLLSPSTSPVTRYSGSAK